MKYEDVVACIGESDAVQAASDVSHSKQTIDKDDFCCYMADNIRTIWAGLQELRALEQYQVLDRLTFPDVENFCYKFTSSRPQSHYSHLCTTLDGL